MSDSSAPAGSISFFTLLGLMFIGLKLAHVIRWSWWLVTLPLWGGAVLAVLLIVLVVVVALVSSRAKKSSR